MKPRQGRRTPALVPFSGFFLVTTNLAAQTGTRWGRVAVSVRQSVQAFYDAYNAHAFDKLTQFTTEDSTHIAPNGIARQGRPEVLQALKQTHATFLKGVTDTPEDIAVRLATPSVAIATVRSRSSTFTTPDGVTHQNEARIRTFVLVKRDSRWLIIQDQNTVANQPPTRRLTNEPSRRFPEVTPTRTHTIRVATSGGRSLQGRTLNRNATQNRGRRSLSAAFTERPITERRF